jgi:hypothetical protein
VFEEEELIGDLAFATPPDQFVLKLEGLAIGNGTEASDFEVAGWGQHPDSSG